MNLIVQPQYQSFFKSHLDEFKTDGDILYIVGDTNYVDLSKKNQNDKFFVITENQNISADFLIKNPKAMIFNADHLDLLATALTAEIDNQNKILKIQKINLETEKKRSELEQLNTFLKDQSDEKKTVLSGFHIEELARKNKEKKLIYFLDYVNSEHQKLDFILDLLKTIWLDLKKIGSFYRIGFISKNQNQENCVIEFDGKIDRTKISSSTELILPHQLVQFLADLFKRPVGQLLHFSANRPDHQFIFFFENHGSEFDSKELDIYMSDRISLLSIVVQRWYLETAEIRILKQWQKLFKSYKDPVHVIDEKFNLIQSNYDTLSGQDQKKCYQILAARSEPCTDCPLKSLDHLKMKKQIQIQDIDYEIVTSDFNVSEKKYFFMTYSNSTEINILKSNLIQAEKMATIGQLSNHLAHELNNPLTGLKLYAEMLLSEGQFKSATYENDMNEVLKAIVRSQTILQDLSQFANDNMTTLVSVDFSETVKKTMTLLKSILRSHRIFIDLKPAQVLAHPTYLQQVLFNLIKNSCQAMDDKGTGKGAFKGTLKIYQIEAATYFDFMIEDDGPGLPKQLQDKLFKPFFTTKESEQGTGLGLFLSQKLMNRMAAELIHNSNFTKGTQFILRFQKQGLKND